MGRVRRVTIIVEVENADGSVSEHRVQGRLGDIFRRRSSLVMKPHYGNPGMPATQVEVHIDAMLIPTVEDPSAPLLRITELEGPTEQSLLRHSATGKDPLTITMKELGR